MTRPSEAVPGWAEVEGHEKETAALLLSLAAGQGFNVAVVRTTTAGFMVPAAVAAASGLQYVTAEDKSLSFRTRADAQAYADAHVPPIVIPGAAGMTDAQFMAAVAAAAK